MNEMDDNTKEILSPRASATMAYRNTLIYILYYQAVQTVDHFNESLTLSLDA